MPKKDLTNKNLKSELLDVLVIASQSKQLLDALLVDLLTPTEFRELTNRWQIIKQLEQGTSHREISRDLRVGLSTVNRGVRMLENPTGGFNQVLRQLLRKFSKN